MPREYLLFFAQVLDEFRIPEIHSVCEVLNIKISYDHAAVNTGVSCLAYSVRNTPSSLTDIVIPSGPIHARIL